MWISPRFERDERTMLMRWFCAASLCFFVFLLFCSFNPAQMKIERHWCDRRLEEYRVHSILNCQRRQIVEIIVYSEHCTHYETEAGHKQCQHVLLPPSKSVTLYPLSKGRRCCTTCRCSYRFQWVSFHFCIYSIWWQFIHCASKIRTHTNTCPGSHEHEHA